VNLAFEYSRRNGTDVKVTLERVGAPLAHLPKLPNHGLREEGTTSWGHRAPNGTTIEKVLVRRRRARWGRWLLAIQERPYMTAIEVLAWTSPSHLDASRRFE
jgi:hypothetical protein